MILLIHISIALISLLVSTLVYILPSKAKLRISSGLIAATLGSGTYLVVSTGSPLLRACTMGLIYTVVSLFAVISARNKLASIAIRRGE